MFADRRGRRSRHRKTESCGEGIDPGPSQARVLVCNVQRGEPIDEVELAVELTRMGLGLLFDYRDMAGNRAASPKKGLAADARALSVGWRRGTRSTRTAAYFGESLGAGGVGLQCSDRRSVGAAVPFTSLAGVGAVHYRGCRYGGCCRTLSVDRAHRVWCSALFLVMRVIVTTSCRCS